jgi:GntR family transcriptional regulator, carbon starvation induced regulator
MPAQTKASRTEVRPSKKTGSSVAVTPKLRPELTDQTGEEASLRVHEAIRDDILSGSLAPSTRLRISMLNKKYNVGASPLREALSRLVSENLVVSVDRRGFVVSPMTLTDFRELTSMRKLLEKEALRLSFQHGDERWEAKLIAAFHRLGRVQERVDAGDPSTIAEWEILNREYHDTLVSACGSKWLLRTREHVYICAERYRRICLSIRNVPRDVQKEHKLIRDAALERDVEKACRLIDEHLERTYQKVAESGLSTT